MVGRSLYVCSGGTCSTRPSSRCKQVPDPGVPRVPPLSISVATGEEPFPWWALCLLLLEVFPLLQVLLGP